jgi:RNA polymerase sigma factor (sigma-70 family)
LREAPEKTTTATEHPTSTGTDRLKLLMGGDFDSIVRENSKRLFNIACHMLGNAEEAEEMVQEIFLEAYLSFPNFKGDAPVSNWLYRITMNMLADHINAKKRKPHIADAICLEDHVRAGVLPAGSNSAETEFLKTEALKKIRKAVLELPARYRAVFVLNVVEGYSHKEIAKILDISHGTARAIRVRAARMIKNGITENELTGGGNDDAL